MQTGDLKLNGNAGGRQQSFDMPCATLLVGEGRPFVQTGVAKQVIASGSYLHGHRSWLLLRPHSPSLSATIAFTLPFAKLIRSLATAWFCGLFVAASKGLPIGIIHLGDRGVGCGAAKRIPNDPV